MSRLTRSAAVAALAALFALAGCGDGKIIGSGPQPTASPAAVHVTYEYKIPSAGALPQGLATASNTYIYLTEYGTSKIAQLSTGGVFSEIATPTANAAPEGIVFGPDGHVWFAEFNANRIGMFSTFASSAFTEYIIPWVSEPNFITSGGPFESLYFTDPGANAIGEVSTGGIFTGPFVIPTANAGPQGIVTDQFHDEWFTEYNASKIGELNTSASPQVVSAEYATPTANAHPEFIVAGPDTNLWFTENINGAPQIGTINPSNGTMAEYPLTGAKSAVGLALDLAGYLDFTDPVNNAVGRFSVQTHAVTEYPISTANANPFFMALGPDGRMYFTETAANQIGQLSYF